MILMDAFNTLLWSYGFYFSNILFIGFAVWIAAGRCCQALYKDQMGSTAYYSIEFMVEAFRVAQLIFMICIGTDTAIKNTFSIALWDKISLSTNKITSPEIIHDIIGFIVLFLIYNVLVHLALQKSVVDKLADRLGIARFSRKSVQSALILGFKNLFLIPVGIVYVLNLIHILG